MKIHRKHIALLALLGAAVLLALAQFPRAFIEHSFSTGLYPHLERLITPISNLVPFALFDALILAIVGMWLQLLIVDIRRERGQWKRVLTRVLTRSLSWASVLYVAFVLLWGLNYRRVRLADKLEIDAPSISPAGAYSLATTAVDLLNASHDEAHVVEPGLFGPPDSSLANGFRRAQQELGSVTVAVPARPKPTLLNPFLRLTGVGGVTDPYFLEVLIENSVLPVERPFTIAHEWGHLAGYADESEANFIGWLTCIHGSTADQYSGWLFVFQEMIHVIGEPDRSALILRLGPGVIEDLRLIYERDQRQTSPRASRAWSRAYDGYLKANRIPSGVANYREVVPLLLGTSFGPDWTPQRIRSSTQKP